ncbi:glycine N-methyltransferase-like [Diadema antillarum]|uniref:glycine N-methyltransferase-like n=1 Tax=Diadema antillarum TaxID=105358 RepID=UPI003A8A78B2
MENWTGNPFDDSEAVSHLGALARRSSEYEEWLLHQLKSRGCTKVLDVACGTGVDSITLLNNNMEVVSCDDAEAMLCHARKERPRMKNESHDISWDIIRANWLTLQEDLPGYRDFGSSIFHLIDSLPELPLYRQCLTNFKHFLKPGGLLLIDHRNMDSILDRGFAVNKNVYHEIDTVKSISTNIKEKDGSPALVEITYDMIVDNTGGSTTNRKDEQEVPVTMPLTPLRVHKFGDLLKEVFGEKCEYSLYGDLRPFDGEKEIAYFQHSVENI